MLLRMVVGLLGGFCWVLKSNVVLVFLIIEVYCYLNISCFFICISLCLGYIIVV